MQSNVTESIVWIDPKSLIESSDNPNQHSPEQIDRLSKIISYQGWRHPIIVRKETGLVISGHGRLKAALKMRLEQVPIQIQSFETDEKAYAFMVADNAIASWAELDLSSINMEIQNFGPDFDLETFGLKDFTLDRSEKPKRACPKCGYIRGQDGN